MSTSKQRVPGGQGSRNALASNPAPSSTTWRQPCWLAPASRLSRNTVRPTTQTRSAAARRPPGGASGSIPPAAANAAASGSAKRRSGRAVSLARTAATASPVPPTPSSVTVTCGGGVPVPLAWLAAPWPGPAVTASVPNARAAWSAKRSASSRSAARSATVSASPFRPARTIQQARISGRAQIAPASRPISSSVGVMCAR